MEPVWELYYNKRVFAEEWKEVRDNKKKIFNRLVEEERGRIHEQERTKGSSAKWARMLPPLEDGFRFWKYFKNTIPTQRELETFLEEEKNWKLTILKSHPEKFKQVLPKVRDISETTRKIKEGGEAQLREAHQGLRAGCKVFIHHIHEDTGNDDDKIEIQDWYSRNKVYSVKRSILEPLGNLLFKTLTLEDALTKFASDPQGQTIKDRKIWPRRFYSKLNQFVTYTLQNILGVTKEEFMKKENLELATKKFGFQFKDSRRRLLLSKNTHPVFRRLVETMQDANALAL